MKTNVKKLVSIPIMTEWTEHTPIVKMSQKERDTFFVRMLACEKYETDQGELWELQKAVKAYDKLLTNCWTVVVKIRRKDILDALADCWYFAFQWASLLSQRKEREVYLRIKGLSSDDYANNNQLCSFTLFKNIQPNANYVGAIALFMYSLVKLANHYNFPLHTAVQRVHTSNLSKRNDQGEFEYDENGKIIKGKNYAPPVLFDLV